MSRYIDADELMAAIAKIGGHGLCEWSTLGVKAVVDRQPTADVVPRAEVERLEGELIVERTRRQNAVNAYHSAKAEVARVIFEDLESICLTHVNRYNRYLIYSEDFAELKKKYTEGGAKNEES